MRCLVTGGCGYVGGVLVPHLINLGVQVVVVDTQWFGNRLPASVPVIKDDIRDFDNYHGFDAVIHLAAVADDPTSDLDHAMTWEIGAGGTAAVASRAARAGVRRFIHASSGSVYGVRKEHWVTEDLALEPVSYYNKVKLVAERVVWATPIDSVCIVRPASVCGFSPRMRLETSINRMVVQAMTGDRITIYGGEQSRPLVDMATLVAFYTWLLTRWTGKRIIVNSPCVNMRVREMADLVAETVTANSRKGCALSVVSEPPAEPPLSYRMDAGLASDMGHAAGVWSIRAAVMELALRYSEGAFKDEPSNYNLNVMKQLMGRK